MLPMVTQPAHLAEPPKRPEVVPLSECARPLRARRGYFRCWLRGLATLWELTARLCLPHVSKVVDGYATTFSVRVEMPPSSKSLSAGEASIAAWIWLKRASHSGRTCACFLLIGPQCFRVCRSATAAYSAAKAGHDLHKRWNSMPSPEPKFCKSAALHLTPSLKTSTKPDG